MDEPTEFNLNFDEMCIRYDCRFQHSKTGETEPAKNYTRAQLLVWNDEVKQIQRDEAQSI